MSEHRMQMRPEPPPKRYGHGGFCTCPSCVSDKTVNRGDPGQQTKSSNPKDVLAREEQRVLFHLIPSPGLVYTALAMMDGARKYGPYNWRDEGVGAGTYISAAQRHIRDWLDGEEEAPDSGTHHLGHAAACLMILMDAKAIGNLKDDRPAPAPTAEMMESVKQTGRVE